MGGFLLIKKPEGIAVEETEKLYSDSINVFERKGLRLSKRIATKEFVVYVFHKHKFQIDSVTVFGNDQFVISTGTCIYNGKIGCDALKQLYIDFSEKGEFLSNLCGHYCLIISKEGKLYLLNDWTGVYHVYSNRSKNVISSSFLAVLKTLKAKNISTQELYEYVFSEASYGDQTLIKEIELIDSRSIYRLSPLLRIIPKTLDVRGFDNTSSFDEMVEVVASSLVNYFGMLEANFDNSICSALTGGYDTRLLLALMKKVRIRPSYLYVYDDSRQPTCVAIAKSIATGENLAIEYEDMSRFPESEEDDFLGMLENNYFMYDGLGHEGGIFDSGWSLYARLKRADKARLQLNGGGGEVFRNFWRLPDKPLHVIDFVRSRYDFIDRSVYSDRFDEKSYFSILEDKVKHILNTNNSKLSRQQVEMLFPLLRGKYWMGSNNSINNQLTYALTPFIEPRFIFQSFNIPLKYKNFGVFEAALIKFIDPDLAKYPSQYGHNFYDGITLSLKMQDYFKIHSPLWLKVYIRKHLWSATDVRLALRRERHVLPFYLSRSYLDKIFLSKGLAMSEYFHTDKIDNPRVLSRVLTAELVIADRF